MHAVIRGMVSIRNLPHNRLDLCADKRQTLCQHVAAFHTHEAGNRAVLWRRMCVCVCVCVCFRVEERKPGIISDRNGLMGRHCMRSWPRETHGAPASERMSCIFRRSYKFTPLPLCPLSCLDCLSGLTGHSGGTCS